MRLFIEAVRGFVETLRTPFLALRMPVEVVRLLKDAMGVQIVEAVRVFRIRERVNKEVCGLAHAVKELVEAVRILIEDVRMQ